MLDVVWADDPAAALKGFGEAIRLGRLRGFHTWVTRSGVELKKAAERTYRASIQATVTGGMLPTGTLQCVSPIGMFREYGTGLYGPKHQRITARGGRYRGIRGSFGVRNVLRWVSDGREIFARSVKGSRPRPWFWPTMKARELQLMPTLTRAIKRSVTRAGG